MPLRAPEVSALIRSGACDELAPLSSDAFPFAHDYCVRQLAIRGPSALAEPLPRFEPRTPEDEARIPMFRALRRIQAQLELLGMHISDHPMRVLRREADRAECVPSSQLRRYIGERIRFAGLIAALRRARTKHGEVMIFATFEDEHGLVEATLSPKALATLGDPIANPGPFLLTARVRDEGGVLQLEVARVMPFYRRERRA